MKFNKVKAIAAASAIMSGLPAIAAEGDIDTTAASGAITKIQTAITTLFTTSLIPAVLTVIGTSIALGLVFLGLRYLWRAGKAAK